MGDMEPGKFSQRSAEFFRGAVSILKAEEERREQADEDDRWALYILQVTAEVRR